MQAQIPWPTGNIIGMCIYSQRVRYAQIEIKPSCVSSITAGDVPGNIGLHAILRFLSAYIAVL